MKNIRAINIARGLSAAGLLLLLLVLPTPAAAFEQKLTATDGAAGSLLGRSVAIDGDTAAVGAPGANAVAVYVFTRTLHGWTQTARLTASDGAAGDRFGFSVAIDGDTIVVGAPNDEVRGNPEQGSAYTFARTGAAERTETGKLTGSDDGPGDLLGYSVALDGDTIVAGAVGDDVGANQNQGSAYTFTRTGAPSRTETAKLTASGGSAGDDLGQSVAIGGDTIVAGAPGDDIGGVQDRGSAYIFAVTGAAARTENGRLIASNGSRVGWSVAVDGETIVAGAPGENIGANVDQGSAYTFARTGAGTRSETAKLVASDGAAGDLLGLSVAIDGTAIAAGAPLDDVGANAGQGCAYTFARTGAAVRSQTSKLSASDGAAFDELGSSVALDGGTIVAGAPFDDVGANGNQGSATIFSSPPTALPCPSPPPDPVPATGAGPKSGACANTRRGTNRSETLVGGSAGDRLFGLGGNDVLSGLAGNDCLFGGSGADRLLGGRGNDRLQGDRGNDKSLGGSGHDRLLGAGGRDRLTGGTGNDRLSGGAGHDRLSGGSGNDRLAGGRGNDRLSGGRGRNRYSAGRGNDSLNTRNGRRERIDCGPGRDKATVDRSDRLRRCERVSRPRPAARP